MKIAQRYILSQIVINLQLDIKNQQNLTSKKHKIMNDTVQIRFHFDQALFSTKFEKLPKFQDLQRRACQAYSAIFANLIRFSTKDGRQIRNDQDLTALQPNSENLLPFLYMSLRKEEENDNENGNINNQAISPQMPEILANTFIPIFIPKSEDQGMYDQSVLSLGKQVHYLKEQVKKLQQNLLWSHECTQSLKSQSDKKLEEEQKIRKQLTAHNMTYVMNLEVLREINEQRSSELRRMEVQFKLIKKALSEEKETITLQNKQLLQRKDQLEAQIHSLRDSKIYVWNSSKFFQKEITKIAFNQVDPDALKVVNIKERINLESARFRGDHYQH